MKVKCFGCDAVIEADDADSRRRRVRGPRAGEPHLVHTRRRRSGTTPATSPRRPSG